MILVNTDYIAGQELEMLGLVKGSTIQSKNIGRDITQGAQASRPVNRGRPRHSSRAASRRVKRAGRGLPPEKSRGKRSGS